MRSIIQLLRPQEYLGICFFCSSVGFLMGGPASVTNVALSLLANSFALAFAFAFNDLQDVHDDKKSKRGKTRNPLVSGQLSKQTATRLTALVLAISIIASALLSFNALIINILTLLLGFLYSWRVVRLKSIAFIDVLSHGLFIGPMQFFLALVATDGKIFDGYHLSFVVLFGLISGLSDLSNEIRDYDADRKANLKNLLSIIDLRKFEAQIHYLRLALRYLFWPWLFLKFRQRRYFCSL